MATQKIQNLEMQGVTDTIGMIVPDRPLTNGETHAVFTIEDVLPHRKKCAPMPTGVAAFSGSDMFKSKSCFSKPKSKRFDHRISEESASRQGSSLKGAMKHFGPGVISLGGGLPSSDYFPLESIDIKVPVPAQFSELETATTGQVVSAGKHDIQEGKSQFDLSIALNYCQSTGAGQMLRFVTEHTEMVHNPPYSDWACTLTPGSTAALDMSFRTFGKPGDFILTEEYSFSTAIETARPLGLKVLGVRMDDDGLLATDLDDILSNWDEKVRKAPRPFLLYTVPSGQNPTGSTQTLSRRKEIYAVAEKYDLYILEDEPYYFLQMEDFISGTTHKVASPFKPALVSDFLSSLIPSFLSMDKSGRVLRLDSFSKIIAPGSRCGWLTGSDQVIERFIRATEVNTQSPSGFSMMILYKLLEEAWGHKGFLEWLMYIRAEYSRRRDIIVNACERHLPTEVCSWIAPKAGMFHWIKMDITKHPSYSADAPNQFAQLLDIEDSVFMAAVAQGVLCSKGSWFRAQKGTDTELFLRTTFAAASAEKIEEGIMRLGVAARGEFGIRAMNGHAH